jgi:hypothetical protein
MSERKREVRNGMKEKRCNADVNKSVSSSFCNSAPLTFELRTNSLQVNYLTGTIHNAWSEINGAYEALMNQFIQT